MFPNSSLTRYADQLATILREYGQKKRKEYYSLEKRICSEMMEYCSEEELESVQTYDYSDINQVFEEMYLKNRFQDRNREAEYGDYGNSEYGNYEDDEEGYGEDYGEDMNGECPLNSHYQDKYEENEEEIRRMMHEEGIGDLGDLGDLGDFGDDFGIDNLDQFADSLDQEIYEMYSNRMSGEYGDDGGDDGDDGDDKEGNEMMESYEEVDEL